MATLNYASNIAGKIGISSVVQPQSPVKDRRFLLTCSKLDNSQLLTPSRRSQTGAVYVKAPPSSTSSSKQLPHSQGVSLLHVINTTSYKCRTSHFCQTLSTRGPAQRTMYKIFVLASALVAAANAGVIGAPAVVAPGAPLSYAAPAYAAPAYAAHAYAAPAYKKNPTFV
ncbi:hypothetical protein LSTR_LSTR009853 [Laodelphax striatellus]|uniref:Uncharacterized protein n=1 Tax=Laodelphax striatellus TaxID=195883 RepID=A0A482XR60_LAOST|nr:hypothetical protein LSTR_LSTR009853 [Laodelphax striatellus]